jgi:hypothetical protein
MKKCGEVDIYIYVFLISTLEGGKLSASRPSCFTPRESSPVTIV